MLQLIRPSSQTLSPQTAKTTLTTPEPPTQTITLDVAGMKCAGCVKVVERNLLANPGVISACVNLVTQVAVVEYKVGTTQPTILAQKLTTAGFPTQSRCANLGEATPGYISPAQRRQRETKASIWRLITAGVLILLSGLGHLGHHFSFFTPLWFHWGLATATLLGPGRQIVTDGFAGLRRLTPNMNTLVGLGAVTAYSTSVVALLFPQLGWECFFDEPVMLLGFILLGRTLEGIARGRAASAFEALLSLKPTQARLVKAQAEQLLDAAAMHHTIEIPADQVRVGEWLQVLPSEKIPVDGEIIVGRTTVDESMLTGEPMPVSKHPGELVNAGTINQSGVIILRATRTGKDTTLAQIVALVEAAQTRKAPVQQLADTVAGYFTYGVMTAAALTFGFWYFVGAHIWPDVIGYVAWGMEMNPHSSVMMHQPSALLLSLKLAIAVLVVACPCALGLATPTAILVGTGLGAERGLLIKGGDVLERVQQLDTIIFDKTGTLTSGKPTVTDCISLGEDNLESIPALLQLAAATESGTCHPLAEAIVLEASRQKLSIPVAAEFHTASGLGVSAVVEGKTVLVGSEDWLIQQGIRLSDGVKQQAQELANAGKTIVYVANNGKLAGLIAAIDLPRPDAKTVVESLRQMGFRVMLLTGDRHAAAMAIAQPLGFKPEDILAEIRPDGKAAAIAQLQNQGHRVAMIGDGINDAPALAQADVGVALHAGTDVAIESAQIILMRDRLIDLVESIQLAGATVRKIRQNLFWALAYNTLGIPIAAGVLAPCFGIVLSPAAAGAMMAFSSVSVVTNSLLLRRSHRADFLA